MKKPSKLNLPKVKSIYKFEPKNHFIEVNETDPITVTVATVTHIFGKR